MEIYQQQFRSYPFEVENEETGKREVKCCILNYKGEDVLCELFDEHEVAHLPLFKGKSR
jgi:hypothetical protein